MIEVILLERIERLGQLGQVVRVRPGFARNYLLPQNKALRATKSNLEQFEKQRAKLEAQNATARDKAQNLAAEMDKITITVIRQASETGHLYGSVSARDIAEAAKAGKHAIDRGQVQIDTPIKTLGLFPVKLRLHPEVAIAITINVARSPEEAAVQLQKGEAVLKASEERAEVVEAFGAPEEQAEDAGEAKKPRKAKAAKTAEARAKAPAEEAEEPKAKKPRAKKAAAE
jgi:large subunit ribosomal protein L9